MPKTDISSRMSAVSDTEYIKKRFFVYDPQVCDISRPGAGRFVDMTTPEAAITPAQGVILGLIQGLTEYLPVSSSGHLVIAQNLFGLTEPELFFDIVLHLGTLSAVVWYYWNDITGALAESSDAVRDVYHGCSFMKAMDIYPGFRLVLFVLLGSIPTGLIGVLFKDQFEGMFGSISWVGVMLMITGVILLLTRFTTGQGRGIAGMRWYEALIIGVAQGMAIAPGISRSGITIAMALFLGLERETSARFSFMLFIPAILGAVALQSDMNNGGVSAGVLALGFITALLVGYFCLKLLVMFVRRGRLSWFAYYCLLAGFLTYLFL